MIDTSILIATCSRAGMLERALDSLLPQAVAAPFAVEFVIVDDCSGDHTQQVLANFARRSSVPVKFVTGEGRGIAAARNLAIQYAAGKWLASCDDDQLAAPGWLEILRGSADDLRASFVGGSMELDFPNGFRARNFGPRAQRLLGYAPSNGQPRRYAQGSHPATSNVLMRASVVRQLGGFDVTFTQGGEDRDLFERAEQAGYRMWFEPRAGMRHMLTERRVQPDGLRWTSLRIGSGALRMQQRRSPYLAPLRHAAVRTALALVRDLPMYAAASLMNKPVAALDMQCSLWYTSGVLRAMPGLLQSHGEQDSPFLRQMNFRTRNGERTA